MNNDGDERLDTHQTRPPNRTKSIKDYVPESVMDTAPKGYWHRKQMEEIYKHTMEREAALQRFLAEEAYKAAREKIVAEAKVKLGNLDKEFDADQ